LYIFHKETKKLSLFNPFAEGRVWHLVGLVTLD